jgi:hypothetical protein
MLRLGTGRHIIVVIIRVGISKSERNERSNVN